MTPQKSAASAALNGPSTPESGRIAGLRGRFRVTLKTGAGRSVPGWALPLDERRVHVLTLAPLPEGRSVAVSFETPESLTPALPGMRCRFEAKVSTSAVLRPGRHEAVLRWPRPLSELVNEAATARSRKLGLLFFCVLVWAVWSRRGALRFFWYDPVLEVYAISLGTYFFSRFFITMFHRLPPPAKHEPTLSIVISVRNERNAIGRTVASCFATDYPPEKREIMVINDGSTDGTLDVLEALRREFPDLKVYSIPASGKRFAMAKGIREAKGEIVVVVDSDTLLDRGALRNIVRGFEDRTLGAASGITTVANADKNWLTRMQDLRYLVSYEMMKAPESVFGCVTCCPGSLSAYRREYLMKILDPWLNQTFLGKRATFGDDRSLTNHILRDYRVIYNPDARSSTIVPETWIRYLRQQCRWKKSWLREAPIAARILARKNPIAALSFYASAAFSLASPYMAIRYLSYGSSRAVLNYIDGLFVLGLLMGLYAHWRRPTKHWYVTWYWIATQVLVMGPQTYYAILTMRKNHWGTR